MGSSDGARRGTTRRPARPAVLAGALGILALLLLRACASDDESFPSQASPTGVATGSPATEERADLATPTMTPATAPPSAAARTATPTASPSPPDPSWLLPDLQTIAPRELYIETNELGLRELRFSTTVVNLGDGPLEMIGESSAETGTTVATQLIQTRDSDATWAEHAMGTFVFHPEHRHWHVEDFTQFDLWSVTPDGRLDELYATTGKMSFCIVDSEFISEEPRNAVGEVWYVDCSTNVQGISVGWGDTYEASLPGQALSLVGVPPGRYALVMTVDPDNRVIETNDANNTATQIVDIDGDAVAAVAGQ